MNDTVYYVFDITNGETWGYFRKLYRHFTYDWGYSYHKLDFTRAAVIYENARFANRRMTLAQAYRRAVEAIREGMGEEAFLLMCGGLYDPIIGLVDSQRTGSDVLSMWSSTVNKDGKTAPYTIRQSLERFPSEADVYIKKTGAHCVCIINWSDTEEKIPEVRLGTLGLEPEGRYVACDFYSETYRTELTTEDAVVFPALKPHGATVIKVERIGERPVIIGSDGHYSMGAECTRLEIEGGALRVARKALLSVDIHYRILLQEGWTAEQGEIVDVTLAAGVEEVSIPLKRIETVHE